MVRFFRWLLEWTVIWVKYPSTLWEVIQLKWAKATATYVGEYFLRVGDLDLGHSIDPLYFKNIQRVAKLRSCKVSGWVDDVELQALMPSDKPIEVLDRGQRCLVLNGNGRISSLQKVYPHVMVMCRVYK